MESRSHQRLGRPPCPFQLLSRLRYHCSPLPQSLRLSRFEQDWLELEPQEQKTAVPLPTQAALSSWVMQPAVVEEVAAGAEAPLRAEDGQASYGRWLAASACGLGTHQSGPSDGLEDGDVVLPCSCTSDR